MAFDSQRGVTVLFGGRVPSGSWFSDTWEWNVVDWTPRAPTTSPAERYGSAMAYDARRGVAVLFGGYAINSLGSARASDTWEWDGTDWTEVTPASSPVSPRYYHAMAYDPAVGQVMLHGGIGEFGAVGDAWFWNGSAWAPVLPTTEAPPPRGHQALAYDGTRRAALLFGGSAFANPTVPLGDTWVMSIESSVPEENCAGGFDADRDGAVGCADPDCWAACSPACPPGVTGCDPAPPRCGDGDCADLETCRMCPADCGACAAVCGDFHCDAGEDIATCPGDCT